MSTPPITILCEHWMPSRGPTRCDGRLRWLARESKESVLSVQLDRGQLK